ncbi:MAG TPA: DUF58 domain-containing protein [Caldithrix abyssi]|uniref:DUF58 domain-containing protein n=1 Tax=Caldithrix abyssi TaxID=187145 RepID=A0A7V5H469_CALAY|nr:DUF58 domain-containing protein [Caldithrix abyssi]
MKKTEPLNLLDPHFLSKIGNLELISRAVVEGFITGLHKSPFHGFSVEFSQHRPYMTGDSLRFVDWKVYARTDRFYIKQFEEETNLRSYLLLDTSKSMDFTSHKITKWQYATYLAAGLSYLLLQQRDATGLVLFDEAVKLHMRPRSIRSYLKQIINQIENAQLGNDTQIAVALHQIAKQFRRRGLVILISDLLDDPHSVLKGLKHFRHDQHEVIVFQILDRQEVEFNFKGNVLFKDLENEEKIKTQPYLIKEQYRNRMQQFLKVYQLETSKNNIEYQLLFTDEPLTVALTKFLSKRKRLF